MNQEENLKFEQRAVIKFLTLEGSTPAEIEQRLQAIYEGESVSYATVKRWAVEFKRGRRSLEDDPRSGRPATSVTTDNIERIRNLVNEDQRIKTKEICLATGLAKPQVLQILHEHLGLSKLTARWIPRILTRKQMKNRAQCCDHILSVYDADPAKFLSMCVTGDETWIHHFDPESKEESKVWTAAGEDPPVKARRQQSAGKLMLIVFWDAKGPILIDILPHKETVTGAYNAIFMGRLHDSIREKRRGTLTRGVMLLHDNAPAHTSREAQAAIHHAGFTQIPHPPYSPDLAPSDFHLFPHLKKHLRGKRFFDDNELIDAANGWLLGQPEQFYQSGIEGLRTRCYKCILLDGNYVEKF